MAQLGSATRIKIKKLDSVSVIALRLSRSASFSMQAWFKPSVSQTGSDSLSGT